MILTKNLYSAGLLEPGKRGYNSLKIISGYSTAAMAYKHLSDVCLTNSGFTVQLIVGMCPLDGISLSNHQGFIKLVTEDFSGSFTCRYIFRNRPVHSKAYLWFKDDVFKTSFIGSANYTQNAFLGNNREILVENDDPEIHDYFQSLEVDSIYCDDPMSEHLIKLYMDFNYRQKQRIQDATDPGIPLAEERRNLEHVKVSFLARDGSLPAISGLNWGQRDGRGKNQAYIPLKTKVYRSDFFPPGKIHFTINTDDNKTLIATRAQENSKAIHTPQNNSLIGEYFRRRLGLANGAFITKEDLLQYGRTDVDFYKIDDETYYMDFSVASRSPGHAETD